MTRILLAIALALIASAVSAASIMDRPFHYTTHNPPPFYTFANLDPLWDKHGPDFVMDNNDGGAVGGFRYAADRIMSRIDGRLAVSGDCYSACATLSDWVRERTCLLPGATMRMHRASDENVPRGISPFMIGYVGEHGGWPRWHDHRFVTMPYAAARKHWHACEPLLWRYRFDRINYWETAFWKWIVIDATTRGGRREIGARTLDDGTKYVAFIIVVDMAIYGQKID